MNSYSIYLETPMRHRHQTGRLLLRQVLHLQESPQRTALAFAVGIFIAFSPLYPHTVMVLICTWLFRLNFLVLFAAASVNNPWTMVPILGATYWTGALFMGHTDVPTFNWHDLRFAAVYQQILPYAIPFALGGFVLSGIGALLTYPAALYFVSKYRCGSALHSIESLPPSVAECDEWSDDSRARADGTRPQGPSHKKIIRKVASWRIRKNKPLSTSPSQPAVRHGALNKIRTKFHTFLTAKMPAPPSGEGADVRGSTPRHGEYAALRDLGVRQGAPEPPEA